MDSRATGSPSASGTHGVSCRSDPVGSRDQIQEQDRQPSVGLRPTRSRLWDRVDPRASSAVGRTPWTADRVRVGLAGRRRTGFSASALLLDRHAPDLKTYELVNMRDVRAHQNIAGRITHDKSDPRLHRPIGAFNDVPHDGGRANLPPLPLPVLSNFLAPEQPPTFPTVRPVDIRGHRRDNSVQVSVVERLVEGSHAVRAVIVHGSDYGRRPRSLQIRTGRQAAD